MKKLVCWLLCVAVMAGCGAESSVAAPQAEASAVPKSTEEDIQRSENVDYVDVVRYPDQYDGKKITVSGKASVSYLKDYFYFYERAFQPDALESSVFEVELPEGVRSTADLFAEGDYVTVSGIWKSRGYQSRLTDVAIESRWAEAEETANYYQKQWELNKELLSDRLPLTEYTQIINNSKQYKGQYVRTLGKLSIWQGNNTTSYSFRDRVSNLQLLSLRFANYPQLSDKLKNLKDNDGIVISGYYDGASELEDVYIEDYGDIEEVEASEKKWADKHQEEKQKFIAEAAAASYIDVCRSPDSYKGKKLAFSGEVIQIDQAWGGQRILISATSNGDNIVYVDYKGAGTDDKRILEGDWITVYGVFERLKSYQTVLTSYNTVPYLEAPYAINHSLS